MLFKTTNKLFRGTYQYKVVLVVPGAGFFRNSNLDSVTSNLDKIKSSEFANKPGSISSNQLLWRQGIKTVDDLDYAYKLRNQLEKMSDFDIRVESPFVSIYTNSEKDVNLLSKIDDSKVKYISKPPSSSALVSGTIILPKINFEYKVTMGKTTQEHSAFIGWAETNKKVKLTKSCIRELSRSRSWGGTYFYITGDNNLLMAKMHLGSSINKVERISKA